MPAPLPRQPVRPLLKWAGGKRQLLPALSRFYPEQFRRYLEPFFGSGAVFFDLYARGLVKSHPVSLFDVNPDLIGCYRTLRDHPDEVIDALALLQDEHRERGNDCYYDVRDRRFNPLRTEHALGMPGRAGAADAYTPALAAMLIYLNRTGFNGLFRLNRGGQFNVPAGRYARPTICDPAHLRTVAAAFRSRELTLRCAPFDEALAEAGDGDFVYCDPPYAPLSRTSSFAHYTAGGFSAIDQRRLQQRVIEACRRGASVVVSNSSAREILVAYTTPEAQKAGLVVHHVPARRAINSRASARGPVDELIITNVKKSLDAIKPRMMKARPAIKRKTA